MGQSLTASQIPAALTQKLRLVRKRKLSVQAATAAAAALAVLFAAMGVAMLIDYLATLYDSPWRLALTASAIGVALLTAIGWTFVARRSLQWNRLAEDVDREAPEFEERWTTVTRLGQEAADAQRVHPAMFRRVASEAARMAPRVQAAEVVDMSPLVRCLLACSVVTAVLGLAVVLDPRQATVLFRRFWQPRSTISATELVDVTDDSVVGRGEPFAVEASLEGTPVERATLFLLSETRGGEAKPPATADLRQADDSVSLLARGDAPIKFVHRIDAVKEPFAFRLRAGDGQTEWRRVAVADRPEVEAVKLTITPPEYTGRPAKEFAEMPRQVSAMKGSRLELELRPNVALKQLRLERGDGTSVALPAGDAGWYRWEATLDEGFSLSPVLTEPRGLTNRRVLKTEFSVYPDQPPAVNVLIPDESMSVRPDDTIEITFAANDDVGVESAELLVYNEADAGSDETPIASIPIELGEEAGASAIQRTVELDLSQFAVADGEELSYEIRVREGRGAAKARSAEVESKPPAKKAAPASAAAPATMAEQAAEQDEQSAASAAATPRKAPAEPPASSDSAESTSTAADALANDASSPRTESPSAEPNAPPNKPATAEAGAAPSATNAQSQPMQKPPSEDAPSPRTASSGRQGLSSKEKEPAASEPTPDSPLGTIASSGAEPTLAAEPQSETAASPSTKSPSNKSPSTNSPSSASPSASASSKMTPPAETAERSAQPPGDQSSPPTAGQMAASDSPTPPTESTPPPPNAMSRRAIDVAAQSASSQRMTLKVDQWAGSFAGQQQIKLAIAIAPDLEALDQVLQKGERLARGALKVIDEKTRWSGVHDRDVTSAQQSTLAAQDLIAKLQDRTADTPYAFVGLQVADIGLAHIAPAGEDLWKTLQAEGGDRRAALANAAQHLTRARELVAELRGQFERTRREFQLAATVERIKKMYQAYVENSQALLQTQDSDPTRYNRDMVEFDLDDDYLKRLQEVMEMRRDLRAELARILAEDPRLLRRFMDSLRNRSTNLREELTDLVADQKDLNREVLAWARVDQAGRPRMARLLLMRQALDFTKTAGAAGELQSRYQTWLSLVREAEDADLAVTTQMVQEVAALSSELNAAASTFVTTAQRLAAAPANAPSSNDQTGDADDTTDDATADETAVVEAPADSTLAEALDPLLADGDRLYERLTKLEVALRQLAVREDDAETAAFAANRLVETRRLIAGMSAWQRQMRAHQSDDYAGAAEVDQYRLALKTDELAGKLGGIEQTLAALMQREDGSLPAPIAEKAREFLATLDEQASPNQLAAVFALRKPELPRATARQKIAGDALVEAEKAYDEMMRLAIEELDKLPVQDPIADLLDDPTLDELLAQLERELPLEELLGIPQRPSNLQIVDDWLRPGGDNSLAVGGSGGVPMVTNQMRQDDQRARQKLDRAYQRALARALKEAKPRRIEVPLGRELSNWNQLASRLGDELQQGRDKAPPEQYRRAIEQYFAEISRAAAERRNK